MSTYLYSRKTNKFVRKVLLVVLNLETKKRMRKISLLSSSSTVHSWYHLTKGHSLEGQIHNEITIYLLLSIRTTLLQAHNHKN